MHEHVLRSLRFDHATPPDSKQGETRTWMVVGITAAMMVVEIIGGIWTGSQSLEADGWHMATHAGAIGLSGFALWYARTRAHASRFSFGTGKVAALAAWSSAALLVLVGLGVAVESVWRLWLPEPVKFQEALGIAIVGLLVNVVSARLLHDADHSHGAHGHDHLGHSDHGHHDHAGHADHDHHPAHAHSEPSKAAGKNLAIQAAYLHVLLDMLTSVAAIVALVAGHWFGSLWMDPLVGLLGGGLILRWAVGLLRESAVELLDLGPDDQTADRIRARLEAIDDVRVADLHVWELGYGRRACLASVVTHTPREANWYRAAVLEIAPIDHLTVEVHPCTSACVAP